MNDNQNMILSHVLLQLSSSNKVDEEEIEKLVGVYMIINPLTSSEKKELVVELHSKLQVKMDRGAFVKLPNHQPWYNNAKKNIDPAFWDRYRTYLFKYAKLGGDVVNSLDIATDDMMDLIGDPSSEYSFQRRGLVIGDVQSGKTATYTALINKAADSGYRIIILLTGTIEKLRRQTQGRLDEGFVGLDSTAFNRNKDNVYIGVGEINSSISGWAVTSTSSDFNTSTGSKLSGKLSGITNPVLFVLKKNTSVLSKLETWLRMYNANPQIELPMLLIDDEADNASVNTRSDEDPTTINSNIRKLLKLFVKANYVGFTATPYANIFINPESNKEMLDDDLFPRDFIYALEPPTNYVGARSIFSEDGAHKYMLKCNDDCEYFLPHKHPKDSQFINLPESLKEAIVSFFIGNAIRDLRGDIRKHRTMLINISRFISVQESIKKAIDLFVREFQREIKNHFKTGRLALEYDSFKIAKTIYLKHYAQNETINYTWDEIQESLHDAIASIAVRTVNGGNAPKNLNYEDYEDGLRLIAVGGYSLSRGLTLEGLFISYFYRNSKMYDTLMQMGRWFGYRDGYADICQIWMGDEAISWYRYISVASEELRREVRKMQYQNKTPMDFGLSVRSDINALLVTARNKMKTAKDYQMSVSISGKMIETPFVHSDKVAIMQNYNITKSFFENLNKNGYNFISSDELFLKNPQILDFPKQYVVDFLSVFNTHFLNTEFRSTELIEIIENDKFGILDKWDLVIANGISEESFLLPGIDVRYVERSFSFKENVKAIQFSGSKSRLGSTTFAKGGLTKVQVSEIEGTIKKVYKLENEKKSLSEDMYFRSGVSRRPLLVVYPVKLKTTKKINDEEIVDEQKFNMANELRSPIIGLSIGIPIVDGHESIAYLYKINLIKYNELLEQSNGIFEQDDIDEDEVFIYDEQ